MASSMTKDVYPVNVSVADILIKVSFFTKNVQLSINIIIKFPHNISFLHNCCFRVRRKKEDGTLVISLSYAKAVKHYLILVHRDGQFGIASGPKFANIMDVSS